MCETNLQATAKGAGEKGWDTKGNSPEVPRESTATERAKVHGLAKVWYCSMGDRSGTTARCINLPEQKIRVGHKVSDPLSEAARLQHKRRECNARQVHVLAQLPNHAENDAARLLIELLLNCAHLVRLAHFSLNTLDSTLVHEQNEKN
ncbi:hypothetical protein DL89DRAFT_259595 [Linderina pennispora]|uniref:Uncharacterized protein n=1 Tax=Linderina pennispora TaxID=61395 RepID=A0A1Y1W0N7_9FUNG|nr:uncharacterized protein DL89DRAFT_259595 [Linderina pennispora]ORX67058.1 hypothetical protein DL89DRAFT_259595 [Linderina pennispora]